MLKENIKTSLEALVKKTTDTVINAAVNEVQGQVKLVKSTMKWYLYGGILIIALVVTLLGTIVYKLGTL